VIGEGRGARGEGREAKGNEMGKGFKELLVWQKDRDLMSKN